MVSSISFMPRIPCPCADIVVDGFLGYRVGALGLRDLGTGLG